MLRSQILIKSVIHVKEHVRSGARVKAHIRDIIVSGDKPIPKMSVSNDQMALIGGIIEKNNRYLEYLSKIIAKKHNLEIQFKSGKPVGDIADLINEGKLGMIVGGMESINKKLSVDQLTQMKTRAKVRMRNLAKKLMGNVSLPRDVIKDLAIISTARSKLEQQEETDSVTSEAIAKTVTLKKRTREGGYVELSKKETIVRIHALEKYKGAQSREEFDIQPLTSEANSEYWTEYTHDQRQRRELINKSIDNLVDQKILTPDQRDILYLKFYFDQPEYSRKDRSFDIIAKKFDEKSGKKFVKVRKKVGDNHRFKFKQHKSSITGKIVKVGSNSFTVEHSGTKYKIPGKPPIYTIKGVNKAEIWKQYTKAVEILSDVPELKRAWGMLKSIWTSISLPIFLFGIPFKREVQLQK